MTHNTSGDSVDRHEQFLVPFGTKRLTEVPELGMPSTSTFYFVGEDHTLGNVLRSHLLHSSHVVFAGYRVPRPDEAKMEIRVQTDGEITPREAVVEASRELIRFCDLLSSRFFLEFELKKSANAAAAVKAGAGGLGGERARDNGGEGKGPTGEEIEKGGGIKEEEMTPNRGWVMSD